MEQSIRDSGEDRAEKVMEFKYGQMEPSILVFGKKIKLMVKDSSFMLMEMFMKVSGLRTKHMEMADTSMQMEPCTRDNGSTIFKTDQEWKNGPMALLSKGLIKTVLRMDQVIISGLMDLSIMGNG